MSSKTNLLQVIISLINVKITNENLNKIILLLKN